MEIVRHEDIKRVHNLSLQNGKIKAWKTLYKYQSPKYHGFYLPIPERLGFGLLSGSM